MMALFKTIMILYGFAALLLFCLIVYAIFSYDNRTAYYITSDGVNPDKCYSHPAKLSYENPANLTPIDCKIIYGEDK